MARLSKSRRILIPDIPPPVTDGTRDGVVIISIGVLCAAVVIAALIFVFLGT